MRSRYTAWLTPGLVATLLVVGSLFLMLVLAAWRLRLGLTRYFDMDEFAYLNWAAHIKMGYRPYLDFLNYAAPLFPWILSLIFAIWQGVSAAIVGRIGAWVVFLFLSAAVSYFFWEVRRSWLAIVAGLVLMMLPMPSDKFLEIRPDTLAMLWVAVAYIFAARWIREEKRQSAFWAGCFLSLGWLTFQKVAPFLLMVSLVGLAVSLSRRSNKLKISFEFFRYVFGLVGPLIPFIVWALFSVDPELVFYSVVRLPVETAWPIAANNWVPPLFYFSPNSAYYGDWGYGWGIVGNHLLWLVGLTMAVFRLISLLSVQAKYRWFEALLAASLLLPVGAYIWVWPLKHPQYLILMAPWVAWYVADAALVVWQFLKLTSVGRLVFAAVYFIGLILLWRVFVSSHQPKLAWTNERHFAKMKKIWTTIPSGTFVLDLEGRTLSYPYPYYVCCVPFGQFAPYLSRQLPSLASALEKTKTRYIYQAEINRIGALSREDQEFIASHYTPMDNGEMWVARYW